MNLFKDRNFKPMLLSEKKNSFNSDDYIFEPKFDGHRALIFVSPSSFYIQSRSGKDITNKYPELKNIKHIVTKPCVFDGEIVLFENGIPNFYKLQQRSHLVNKTGIINQALEKPVAFICFDILYYGKNLIDMTLLKRKEILKLFLDNNFFMKIFYIENKGNDLFDVVKLKKLEGIVAKEKNSLYEINVRSHYWIKIKNIYRSDFYIGGFSIKSNNGISLYLGEYVDDEYVFVGKVITSVKNGLYKKLKSLEIKKSSFINCEDDINYIKPVVKCEIEYLEKSKNGKLRHAVFKKIKT